LRLADFTISPGKKSYNSAADPIFLLFWRTSNAENRRIGNSIPEAADSCQPAIAIETGDTGKRSIPRANDNGKLAGFS